MSYKNNTQKQAWYLHKPLVALAPMEAITDRPYRSLVRGISRETILYTEFTNASGLLFGGERVWKMIEFDESERPLIIQIYDSDPEKLGFAAAMIAKGHRPDGIDLNMGCPVRKVANRGAGCGMMADLTAVSEAVRRMVENADGIPVSVKTRLGITSKSEILEVGHACIESGAKQISIHGRLKADRPRVPADWEAISVAAREFSVPVMGNGDIWTEDDALQMVGHEGIDGVMVARGAIGNPWLMERCVQALKGEVVDSPPNREERIRVALKHLELNVKDKGERRGVLEMRKVVRNYIKGFMDSRNAWMKIIEAESELETAQILEDFAKGEQEYPFQVREAS
ncbi:tRNA-dihydrouridine synthase family protein [bacterium]|nr:tRNA-dihydrouridine synthase family protein [bacterium]